MVKAYPQFRSSYSHEEMVEHFLLTPAELQLVLTCRGDANRCGMALLLKTISHLGYVPDPMPQIPEEVRAFVAAQLGLLWDSSEAYSWHGSTLDYHLAQIRQHSGWRFPTAQDKEELENWLRNQGAKEAHTADALFDSACERLRSLRVELPAEGELERVVNAALNGFFQDIHRWISDALAPDVRAGIDALLVVPESAAVSGFEGLKADPGKAGVDNLQAEIEKLSEDSRDWGWHRAFRERAVESASNAETARVEGDRERDAGPFQCHSLRTDGVLSLCARYGGNGRHHAHGD